MRDIVAIHIDNKTLTDSLGRVSNPTNISELLDFLMINQPNTYILCWNLYRIIELIKHLIPNSAYMELLSKDKVWVDGYKLFSSSGKKLSIGHEYRTQLHDNFYESRKQEVDIYNLYKYFPDYQPKNANDIVTKGKELLTTLETMGIYNPKTLASGIAMYADHIMSNQLIPHLYDCPEEALEMADYALEMMNREWRATYKIGRFPYATQIDVNGCYPSIVKDFGDLANATYWYSNKYEHCDFGLFKGTVTITGDTPIIDSDKQPKIGTYTDIITTEDWAYLNHFKKGHFEPTAGWMLKYNNNYKPCEQIMIDLYKQRNQGGLVSDLSKSFSVGLIGQFSQYYEEKKGKFYNPIYSVMATSRASLKVGVMLEMKGLWNNLVYANVDGVIVDKQIKLGDNRRSLGDFRSEEVDALILSMSHKYIGEQMNGMLMAIKKYPKATSYNDIVLSPEMNITNRVFNEYPRNGNDWINNIYNSEAMKVTNE